jgi:thiol-disulfide isomerase/thioredoxin
MKWLGIFYVLCISIAYAGKSLEIELASGNTISIDAYKADGETLFLYIPSERGLGNGYVSTAQQLAFDGVDVWVADLHSSYMVPKYRSSINRFDVDDLLELITNAKEKSFKNIFFLTSGRGAQLALKIAYQWQLKNPNSRLLKGHIFHSPHLIDGKPDLGAGVAQYVNIAKVSNLPIYILLPQFGTKFLRGNEITNELKQGGSSVFVHRLTGVHGGFHMRRERDLSKPDIKARGNLADTYQNATQLMKTMRTPKILTADKDLKTNAKVTFSEPVLQKYHGKQQLPLKLKTLDDKVVDINDYKNQVLLINFWASWCNPCITEIPSLVRLQKKFKGQDFKIITINIGESKDRIVKFVKKVGLSLPVLLDNDGKATKDWGVYAYPSNFLIDREGVIRYGYRGALEWDGQSIVDTIKTLL